MKAMGVAVRKEDVGKHSQAWGEMSLKAKHLMHKPMPYP